MALDTKRKMEADGVAVGSPRRAMFDDDSATAGKRTAADDAKQMRKLEAARRRRIKHEQQSKAELERVVAKLLNKVNKAGADGAEADDGDEDDVAAGGGGGGGSPAAAEVRGKRTTVTLLDRGAAGCFVIGMPPTFGVRSGPAGCPGRTCTICGEPRAYAVGEQSLCRRMACYSALKAQ